MQSRIVGTTMPVLEVLLQPGEALISEAGELSWMTQTIAMQTHTQMAGGGGFFGAIKRMAGGGTLFMTEYTAQGYIKALLTKTGSRNRTAMVAKILEWPSVRPTQQRKAALHRRAADAS